jgi:hypothetical protein
MNISFKVAKGEMCFYALHEESGEDYLIGEDEL